MSFVCPVCSVEYKRNYYDYEYSINFDTNVKKITKENLLKIVNVAIGIKSFELAKEKTYSEAVDFYSNKFNTSRIIYESLGKYQSLDSVSQSPENAVIHIIFDFILNIKLKCSGCVSSMNKYIYKRGKYFNSYDELEIAVTDFFINVLDKDIKRKLSNEGLDYEID